MTHPNPDTSLPAQDPALAARNEKAEADLMRAYSTEMALWLFCRRAECYRTHACRGDARICVDRYDLLVPEDIVEAARAMFADEDRCGLLGEITMSEAEALERLTEWHTRVGYACARE